MLKESCASNNTFYCRVQSLSRKYTPTSPPTVAGNFDTRQLKLWPNHQEQRFHLLLSENGEAEQIVATISCSWHKWHPAWSLDQCSGSKTVIYVSDCNKCLVQLHLKTQRNAAHWISSPFQTISLPSSKSSTMFPRSNSWWVSMYRH